MNAQANTQARGHDSGNESARTTPRPGRAILGGSFNPPHIGHLRLAVEVSEALGERVHNVDLVPCAHPPHKAAEALLPFDLRAAMLDAAVSDLPRLRCNRLEAGRQGPSYTWDTMLAYRAAEPGIKLYFILGSADFALLPTWFRGLDLAQLCDFIVVPRGDNLAEDFASATSALWPGATEAPSIEIGCKRMLLPGGGSAHFLPLPWLPVSASDIRMRLRDGRSADYLVPPVALQLLREYIRRHPLHDMAEDGSSNAINTSIL